MRGVVLVPRLETLAAARRITDRVTAVGRDRRVLAAALALGAEDAVLTDRPDAWCLQSGADVILACVDELRHELHIREAAARVGIASRSVRRVVAGVDGRILVERRARADRVESVELTTPVLLTIKPGLVDVAVPSLARCDAVASAVRERPASGLEPVSHLTLMAGPVRAPVFIEGDAAATAAAIHGVIETLRGGPEHSGREDTS